MAVKVPRAYEAALTCQPENSLRVAVGAHGADDDTKAR